MMFLCQNASAMWFQLKQLPYTYSSKPLMLMFFDKKSIFIARKTASEGSKGFYSCLCWAEVIKVTPPASPENILPLMCHLVDWEGETMEQNDPDIEVLEH